MAGMKKIKYWSTSDLKTLKQLAGRSSAQRIARVLRRSITAVRVKASERRISLRLSA